MSYEKNITLKRYKSWRNPGFAFYNFPFPVPIRFLCRLITINVKFPGNYFTANWFLFNFNTNCSKGPHPTKPAFTATFDSGAEVVY